MKPDLKKLKGSLGSIDLSARFAEQIKYRVSTGNIAFDRAIGGGIPSGKLTEFYGGESSWKSALLLCILAEAQRLGGIAMLMDVERSLEKGLVDITGIDMDMLIYPEPNELETLEDVFDKIAAAIELMREFNSDGLLVIGLDSLAVLPSKEELDRDEWHVGPGAARRAAVIGDALKKLMPRIYKSNACLIFINQIRDKIAVQYGAKTEAPGGRQVKFWASLRLKMQLAGSIKDDKTKEQVGSKVNLLVAKSKVCVPFREVNFEIPVNQPISRYSGLLDFMIRHSEVTQVGSWYHFPDEDKKWQKKDFEVKYKEKFEKEDKK